MDQKAPAQTLRELQSAGVELSFVELTALESLDPEALGRFASALDPRLQKALLVHQPPGEAT